MRRIRFASIAAGHIGSARIAPVGREADFVISIMSDRKQDNRTRFATLFATL